MNNPNSSTSHALYAAALIVAIAPTLIACGQVVSAANARTVAPATASAVSNGVMYFGDEYARVQATLVADTAAQSPTF